MNVSKQIITEDTLHAYIDEQLDAEQRQAVEQYLTQHPEEAENMRAYQLLSQSLQQAYDAQLLESVPRRLQVATRLSAPAFWQRPLVAAAAAAMFLVTGTISGWMLHGEHAADHTILFSLAEPAHLAHVVYTPEVAHPVEVDAQHEQHLFKWLSNRLGKDVRAPNISKLGYHLIGGRLLPAEKKPAAQFMYENENGLRLTLYMRSGFNENRETAFRFLEEQGVNTFYWVDRSFGYALSGTLPRAELSTVANALYTEFTEQ